MANDAATIQHNALGPVSSRALAYVLAQKAAGAYKDELGAGITTGFAILGYRGRHWRIKYQGNETLLERTVEGEKEPAPSVNVILVKAADHVSKSWYETGYVEGSNAPPDCSSANGITADPNSPKRQGTRDANGQNTGNGNCATCPFNQFGSRVSPDGQSKGKACADTKRIVIVPDGDIDNETLGGPMLLRIPAASLGDLKHYAAKMEVAGHFYFAVATKLSFDNNLAYPKIQMRGVRVLTDDEVEKVIALRDDPRTLNILNVSELPDTAAAPAAPPEPLFEQPPAPKATTNVAPAPAAPPAAQPVAAQPVPAAPPAPAPVAEPVQAAAAPSAADLEAQLRAKIEAELRAQMAAAVPAAPAPAPASAPTQNDNGFGAAVQAATEAPPAPAIQAPASQPVPAVAPTKPLPASITPAAAAEAPAGFDEMLDTLMGG